MLASMLNRSLGERLQTAIVDCYLTQTVAECVEQILEGAPDLVGFSMYIWNRALTLEIAACLKDRFPGLVILAGGPEPTANPEGLLAGGLIDFVLPGECERSIVAVMTYLLEGGDAHRIPEELTRIPVADLAELASPFLDRTLDLDNYSGILWELSRGCPYRCDFCYESRGIAGIRRFPLARIREELRLFTRCGVDQVFVLDPTFNFDREKAKEILKLIALEAPDIYFCFEVRSEFIDEEMAGLFAAIPCSLQIGLQSASADVLRNVARTIDCRDFTEKMLHLHEAGAVYGFDLIYGLPGDSLEGFCRSLDFAMGFRPNHLDIFPLAVLPGTRLQETASSFGLEYQTTVPYQVTSAPTFRGDDMLAASEIARAVDRFYNRGKAVPWFSIMIQTLEMTPSEFFRVLVEWQKGQGGGGDDDGEDMTVPQQEFISMLLRRHGCEQLIPLAVDIITYFGRFESPCDEGDEVSFTHNPFELIELLESGVSDLEQLHSLLPEEPYPATFCAR